jgi:hypothetical protein
MTLLSTTLLIFLILKFAGLVTWSWWIILGPLYVPLIVSIVIILISGVLSYISSRGA